MFGVVQKLSCAREATALELACKYIFIIRLRQVCVWACIFEVCCLNCPCQVTVLELACKYILIIRLCQVAFEVVQHNCAFANCTFCAFEMDDAELLRLLIYLFILNHS